MLGEGVISGKQHPACCLGMKMSKWSLRLLSTSERIKPEENLACHTVVINSKGKIFSPSVTQKIFLNVFLTVQTDDL